MTRIRDVRSLILIGFTDEPVELLGLVSPKSMPQVSGTIAVKSAFLMLFRPCEGCICLIEFRSLAMIIIRAIPLLLNSRLHFSIFCGVKSCNRSPILDNKAPGLFVLVHE